MGINSRKSLATGNGSARQWVNPSKTAACADLSSDSYILCAGCGRKFDPDNAQQKYCTKKCNQKSRKKKMKKEIKEMINANRKRPPFVGGSFIDGTRTEDTPKVKRGRPVTRITQPVVNGRKRIVNQYAPLFPGDNGKLMLSVGASIQPFLSKDEKQILLVALLEHRNYSDNEDGAHSYVGLIQEIIDKVEKYL